MTHPARPGCPGQNGICERLFADGRCKVHEQVLKPVSLRSTPLSEAQAAKVNAWRTFFLSGPRSRAARPWIRRATPPRLVETSWLQENLGRSDLRVLDLRPQPAIAAATFRVPFDGCGAFPRCGGGVSSMLFRRT